MVYRGISHESLASSRYTHEALGESIYQENTIEKLDIPWYKTKECWITILYCYRKYGQCDIPAAHDGKVGCNTVEYKTAFLYSDWLYFLWHGIKHHMVSPLVPKLKVTLHPLRQLGRFNEFWCTKIYWYEFNILHSPLSGAIPSCISFPRTLFIISTTKDC